MPRLHLGLEFDNLVYVAPETGPLTTQVLGPKKLLSWLEAQLGLNGSPENTEYLRIELYRQALLQWQEQAPQHPFYSTSFDADRFATAVALLGWRDELLLAGWDFLADPADSPLRLADLAGVEQIFQKKIANPELGGAAWGTADRYARVLHWLELRLPEIEEILLNEPADLFPPVVQRVLRVLEAGLVPVRQIPREKQARDPESDLAHLQHTLLSQGVAPCPASRDGSLVVLKSRRDSDAALFLAQWLAGNPDWHPVFLIPELNRVLEQALLGEGFPALGVLSASLARPSLQVLKLAPAFIWDPVDVFKIMEFVTLPLKPLDDGLALEIARVLAQKPGLYSDTWYGAVLGYLNREEVPERVREQYEFWFGRRRYRTDAMAPKRDVIELYAYLQRWAREVYDETSNTTLLVLAEQARRIRELLETLPEERLGFLELERIIRTIYEPAPVQLEPAESGHFDLVHQSGAFAAAPERLIWWNCLFDGSVPASDHWRAAERSWLEMRGVLLDDPRREGLRRLWSAQCPVLAASRQLILVMPAQVAGVEVLSGLLLSDMEAAFTDSACLLYDLDDPEDREALNQLGEVPDNVVLEPRVPLRLKPQLILTDPDRMLESAYETPTNLESLFYYPHRWFFRQKLRFFPSSLLGVTRDQTLLGSLAHRFFELMLQESDCLTWDKQQINSWLDGQADDLLEREGATLLLYGREPERNQFLNRVKNAAWSLVNLLRTNNWSIAHTELPLEGTFSGLPIRGKADLVLRRESGEQAIVDLKWSGARRRKDMIRNGEDLQLVLYARMLPPEPEWPHTAYFILEEGKMIARNKEAFRDAEVAEGMWNDHAEACAAILERMERTFEWRMGQIRTGKLEMRTARTAAELEALYGAELLELLEMKTEDARWDDYRILLEIGSGTT
ncbi:MAG: hypothetical protein EP344_09400 [Bacteroidetes bacterium]|nr:MAG: hypothetical protein EP344_09400 [Bacteroidota bacterium]